MSGTSPATGGNERPETAPTAPNVTIFYQFRLVSSLRQGSNRGTGQAACPGSAPRRPLPAASPLLRPAERPCGSPVPLLPPALVPPSGGLLRLSGKSPQGQRTAAPAVPLRLLHRLVGRVHGYQGLA